MTQKNNFRSLWRSKYNDIVSSSLMLRFVVLVFMSILYCLMIYFNWLGVLFQVGSWVAGQGGRVWSYYVLMVHVIVFSELFFNKKSKISLILCAPMFFAICLKFLEYIIVMLSFGFSFQVVQYAVLSFVFLLGYVFIIGSTLGWRVSFFWAFIFCVLGLLPISYSLVIGLNKL